MPEYVSGWCGHEFESHSQPFLLTYPEADLKLMTFSLIFSNLIWRLSCLSKTATYLTVKIGYRTEARALMFALFGDVTRNFRLYDIT